jgi:heme-degrading monooxygenase HmoA
MKIVKVTYTVKQDFAEQNSANIRNMMQDLQAAAHPGIRYDVTLAQDGKTFVHTAFFDSEEDQQKLFATPSFRHFQEEMKQSGPEVPPKQEIMTFVGSSYPLFS